MPKIQPYFAKILVMTVCKVQKLHKKDVQKVHENKTKIVITEKRPKI